MKLGMDIQTLCPITMCIVRHIFKFRIFIFELHMFLYRQLHLFYHHREAKQQVITGRQQSKHIHNINIIALD